VREKIFKVLIRGFGGRMEAEKSAAFQCCYPR